MRFLCCSAIKVNFALALTKFPDAQMLKQRAANEADAIWKRKVPGRGKNISNDRRTEWENEKCEEFLVPTVTIEMWVCVVNDRGENVWLGCKHLDFLFESDVIITIARSGVYRVSHLHTHTRKSFARRCENPSKNTRSEHANTRSASTDTCMHAQRTSRIRAFVCEKCTNSSMAFV